MIEALQRMDWSILQWIHSTFQCTVLDKLMPWITLLGNNGAIWIIAALALLCTKKYRKAGVVLLAALAAGFLIGNVYLKDLIARPRPCWLDTSVKLLIPNPTDYSFPSCHTLSSVIAAVVLTGANRKFACAAIPLAVLIAFSRLYLYVHFPSDVLGAALIGIWIGILALLVETLVLNQLNTGSKKLTK